MEQFLDRLLINRLRVILVEDLFDWQTVIQMAPWLSQWDSQRQQPTSRKYLLSMVQCLVQAPKVRLVSDLKVFMYREQHRQKLGNMYDQIFNGWNIGSGSDLDRMSHLLKLNNPNCLYWYKSDNDSQIWTMLKRYIDTTDRVPNSQLSKVIDTLRQIQTQDKFKNHREGYLYTMTAIAYILFEDLVDWTPRPMIPLMSDQEALNIYQHHIDTWTPDNLPYGNTGWLQKQIVEDMHTRAGRARGMGATQFADIGSMVTNEDQTFVFPVLRQIYQTNKYTTTNQDIPPLPQDFQTEPWDRHSLYTMSQPKPSQVPESEPAQVPVPVEMDLNADHEGAIYGQKVTASWKPLTYITQHWIYKGPYKGKRQYIPDLVVQRYQRLLQLGDQAVFPQIKIIGNDGYPYLKTPNIGTKWPPQTTVDVVDSGTNLVGRIVDRNSMGIYQGDQLIGMEQIDWEKYLYHMILRYILNFGDSGYWNYINNYGIDYEENRTISKSKPTDILQVISNKPITRYREAHLQYSKQLASQLLQRINQFVLPHVNGVELQRTQTVIDLLRV